MNHITSKIICLILLVAYFNTFLATPIITNGSIGNTGDSIVSYCLAKIASIKYNLPFRLVPFNNYELFHLSDLEQEFQKNFHQKDIKITKEEEILAHVTRANVNLKVTHYTFIQDIDFNWKKVLSPYLQLKYPEILKQQINSIPTDCLTIAVHIRKGNGGAHYTDGQQSSIQLFQHDLSKISYIDTGEIFPFDWINAPIRTLNPNLRKRGLIVDRIPNWITKFPPEQFYVDQIKKVSEKNSESQLYVQIFTDDNNPPDLVQKIKNAVNKKNIIFNYHDNRSCTYKQRVAQDIYNMTRFDILIRSQSNFARTVELVGNFKGVIFPLDYRWEGNKLIMHKVFIKGKLT